MGERLKEQKNRFRESINSSVVFLFPKRDIKEQEKKWRDSKENQRRTTFWISKNRPR